MPWSKNNPLDSFKNLNPISRDKAIEIANALLDDSYTASHAIPIALEKVKETKIRNEETKEILIEAAKRYVNKNHGELHIYTEDSSLLNTLYE